MTLSATLRRPGVARLGAAGLLSDVGDWTLFIALPLYVLSLTGSPLVTAGVFALELVPTVVLAPLAGVVIDRCEPWRLMSTVAVLQAVLLLPLLWVDSPARLWIVYVVVVLEASLFTVTDPCRGTTASTLVPPEDLMSVNQLFGMLGNVARLAGGPLGGLLLGMRGIDGVLVADVATFAGAAALFAIRPPRRAPGARESKPPATGRRVLQEWAEGFAVVARTRVLRRLMLVAALASLAQGAFVVLFVLFVVRRLGASEADVGVLRGVQAAGSIAGGLLLASVIRRFDPGRLLALSLGAISALSLLIWNGPDVTTALGVYVALFVAVGVPALTTVTSLLTIVQSHAPEAVRGRVMSTLYAVLGGVQAAGMMIAGFAGTGAALTVMLNVQAGLYLAAALLARGLAARAAPRVAVRPTVELGG